MANLPGRAIPGYEGRYSMTADGTTWYAAGPAFRPMKPQRGSFVHLVDAHGKNVCHNVRTLYPLVFGTELAAMPTYPPPGYAGPAPSPAEVDECGYEPLPGMTDAEAWPADEHKRVLWGTTWGIAVGARGWRWWVVLDGETEPRLIAAAVLYEADAETEAAWKAAEHARWARMAAEVRGEVRHTRQTRAALGRRYAEAR